MKKSIISFLIVLLLACSACGIGLFQVSANTETFVDELALDFTTDTGDFQSAFSSAGWKVEDGVLKPNSAWAVTALSSPISTTGNKYITLDFNLGNDTEDKDQQFLVGFVKDKTAPTAGSDLCANFKYSTWNMFLVTAYETFSTLNWVADYTKNFYDGQTHSLQIAIEDGVVSYSIDWEPVFVNATLDSLKDEEKMYFALQATDTVKYIDNFKVTNTKPYKPINYVDELELDFNSEVSQEDFEWVLGGNGWSASEGKFKANAAWATVAVSKPINTTGEKYITLIFNLGDDRKDETQQFLIGFLKGKSAFAAEEDFCLNFLPSETIYYNAFSKNDAQRVASHQKNYYDGDDHALLIRINDGVVKYEIDGEEILTTYTFDSLADEEKMYFALQSTDTVKYIKEFKLFNTAPTEPFVLPAPLPDGSLDISYANPTTTITSADVDASVNYKTVWVVLSVVFGVLTLASVAGLTFVLIKKRR